MFVLVFFLFFVEASIAALLASGMPVEQLEEAIDATYDDLLGRLSN